MRTSATREGGGRREDHRHRNGVGHRGATCGEFTSPAEGMENSLEHEGASLQGYKFSVCLQFSSDETVLSCPPRCPKRSGRPVGVLPFAACVGALCSLRLALSCWPMLVGLRLSPTCAPSLVSCSTACFCLPARPSRLFVADQFWFCFSSFACWRLINTYDSEKGQHSRELEQGTKCTPRQPTDTGQQRWHNIELSMCTQR